MKKWILTCSTDAVNVDHVEIIEADTEPDFWDCQNIAGAHGCDWWTLEEATPRWQQYVDNVDGCDDEAGAGGFWDFAGEITTEILRCTPLDPIEADTVQDIVYRYITSLFDLT